MSNYGISFYDWCLKNNNKLIEEWNYDKNTISPTEITPFSNRKVWWICRNGHEWEAKLNNRNHGRGCPYCGGKKALQGYNDLSTINPELEKEWNYELNGDLKPTDVTISSNKKVWWKCKIGHSWQATVNGRSSGHGCPICAGQKVLSGFNDLQTKMPKLAEQWHPYKNGELKPCDVTAGTHKSVWWICSVGHEWQASIANRVKGRGCPICGNKKVLLSFNDLATKSPKLAEQWHPTKNQDFTPAGVLPNSNKKYWWICDKGHEWQASINNRQKRGCPECSKERKVSFPEKVLFYYIRKHFSNAVENYRPQFLVGKEIDIYIPELKIGIEYDGEYYHADKNVDLLKDKICKDNNVKLIHIREPNCPKIVGTDSIIYTLKSRKDFDLQCAVEYVFNYIKSKTSLGDVDIDISRDRTEIYELLGLSSKKESIAITHPYLLKEWNYDKNGKILPENITKGSDKKVWWKCEQGYEWEATVSHRVGGRGCPVCSGKRIISGYNDIATLYPDVLDVWDMEKNKNINPNQFGKTSSYEAWWKCDKCGTSFKRRIIYHIEKRTCPNCKTKV